MTPIGDIVRHAVLQHQTTRLQSIVHARSSELATGQVHDLRSHLNGRTGQIHAIKSEVQLLDAYQTSIEETRMLFEARQRGIDTIRGQLSSVVDIALADGWQAGNNTALQDAAKHAFLSVAGTLNSSMSGRPLFGISGNMTSEQTFDDVVQAIAENPNTPPEDVARSIVRQSFGLGNGSSGVPYQDVPIAPSQLVQVSDADTADQLTDILVSLAVVASEQQSSSSGAQGVASSLIASQDALVASQVRIGSREHLLEETQARNAAELNALKAFQNDLTSADPFEAASELQTATLRLETLFAATARISKLSLTNYL